MLKSEMQHQYWLTKKTVQRKFGSKEDECIVSSDAELDSKIELFKSINESCAHLHRTIDTYQERTVILAQEENTIGRFLKETGRNSQTTANVMTVAGKSLAYCGQQRLTLRMPLVRLHHEMETFRGRAIVDTHQTIQAMERERTEYRAALSWMKSASAQLDPDTGRGLDKFRKAQTHVRASKAKFDRLSLDCLQKIDLLAAARCNMFSHALVAYQTALVDFFTKTTETYRNTLIVLKKEPNYNFTVLKELTQGGNDENEPITGTAVAAETAAATKQKPIDSDQMLFFKAEYKDDQTSTEKPLANSELINVNLDESIDQLIGPAMKMLESIPSTSTNSQTKNTISNSATIDLLGLMTDNDDLLSSSTTTASTTKSFMPSQLLLNDFNHFELENEQQSMATGSVANKSMETNQLKKNSILDLFNRSNQPSISASAAAATAPATGAIKKEKLNTKTERPDWFKLFSELDPLANPDLMERKIGGHGNSQDA